MTKEELILSLKNREEEAFQVIYIDNFHNAKNFILANGGTENEVKDVFQDSILFLIKKIDNESIPQNLELNEYFFAIIKSKWYTLCRVNKRNLSVILEAPEIKSNHADIIEELEESRYDNEYMYKEAMYKLEPSCQKLILLTYIERKGDSEIASILGVSTSYVKVLRFRCMQKLRTVVKDLESKLRDSE